MKKLKKLNFMYWSVTLTGLFIFLNVFTKEKGAIWLVSGLALMIFGVVHLILKLREAGSEKYIPNSESQEKSVFIQRKAKAFSYDFLIFMTDISILLFLYFDQTPIVLSLIGVLIFQSILYHLSKLYFERKILEKSKKEESDE